MNPTHFYLQVCCDVLLGISGLDHDTTHVVSFVHNLGVRAWMISVASRL